MACSTRYRLRCIEVTHSTVLRPVLCRPPPSRPIITGWGTALGTLRLHHLIPIGVFVDAFAHQSIVPATYPAYQVLGAFYSDTEHLQRFGPQPKATLHNLRKDLGGVGLLEPSRGLQIARPGNDGQLRSLAAQMGERRDGGGQTAEKRKLSSSIKIASADTLAYQYSADCHASPTVVWP